MVLRDERVGLRSRGISLHFCTCVRIAKARENGEAGGFSVTSVLFSLWPLC